jgi:hypothetical protein
MSSTEEAWGAVADHLRTLGSLVVDRTVAAPDEVDDAVSGPMPTDDEFREAIRVISDRASATLRGLTDSIADPEVRAEAELTTSAFLNAVGVSFSELGSQLADLAVRRDEADPEMEGAWVLDESDLQD